MVKLVHPLNGLFYSITVNRGASKVAGPSALAKPKSGSLSGCIIRRCFVTETLADQPFCKLAAIASDFVFGGGLAIIFCFELNAERPTVIRLSEFIDQDTEVNLAFP